MEKGIGLGSEGDSFFLVWKRVKGKQATVLAAMYPVCLLIA